MRYMYIYRHTRGKKTRGRYIRLLDDNINIYLSLCIIILDYIFYVRFSARWPGMLILSLSFDVLFRFVRHCTLHCSTRITQPCSMTGDNDPSLSLTLWGTALWMAEECSRLFSFATQRDILRENNRSFFRILSIFLNASSILLTVNYNWIIS